MSLQFVFTSKEVKQSDLLTSLDKFGIPARIVIPNITNNRIKKTVCENYNPDDAYNYIVSIQGKIKDVSKIIKDLKKKGLHGSELNDEEVSFLAH